MEYSIREVAEMTGVSTRTLRYYDEIGLLKPSIITEAKYRQYTDDDLTRLQEILFFREVGFALKEIKELLDSPHYVRSEALERHVLILEAQKERIEALISLVKDTSLAANITVTEMFMQTERIAGRTYQFMQLYIEVALVYLIFCTVLTWLQAWGEKKLNYYQAGR